MLSDIYQSYRRMPMWVQIWVGFILVPVNLASLFFYMEPYGYWVAGLAIAGMLPNTIIMFLDRGFGKTMAIPHVIIWTPLCGLLLYLLYGLISSNLVLSNTYAGFLSALLIINIISLIFDVPESIKWFKGDRAPA